MARDQKKTPEHPRARHSSVIREYVEALIVAAVFLGFTNNFVLKTFYIPSGSMENTLLIGSRAARSSAATSSSSGRPRRRSWTWSSGASVWPATS